MNGIIPAAGRGVRFKELGKNYPKCLLPVEGKPIIYWNIKNMFESGVDTVYIVVRNQEQIEKTRRILGYFFPHAFDEKNPKIRFETQGFGKGLSSAVYSAIQREDFDCELPTLIMLSDLRTTSKQVNFPKDCSWISVQKVDSYSRWCMVQTDHQRALDKPIPKVVKFFDKPQEDPKVREAVSGIYFFKDSGLLFDSLHVQLMQNSGLIEGEYQFSGALKRYMREEDLRVRNFDITDYGTLEEYLDNKDLKIGRNFNNLELSHTVKKSSEQKEKIISEINWYRTMPEDFQIYLPRIYSFGIEESEAYYKMERIKGNTLREIFLYLDASSETWSRIFEKIVKSYEIINRQVTATRCQNFNQFIQTKTLLRMRSSGNRFTDEFIEGYVDWLESHLEHSSSKALRMIHGDLCFSNVLWNFRDETVKYIDPRGDVFGNEFYDIAKLTHSILFNYDFIDEELYIESDNRIIILNEGKKEVQNLWIDYLFSSGTQEEVELILALTSSLFLSMIPLHENETNKWLFQKTGERIFEFLKNQNVTPTSLKKEVNDGFSSFPAVPKINSN